MVEVAFDAKTIFAKAKQSIQNSDIKVGDRVVIHALDVNEKLTAHSILSSYSKAQDQSRGPVHTGSPLVRAIT